MVTVQRSTSRLSGAPEASAFLGRLDVQYLVCFVCFGKLACINLHRLLFGGCGQNGDYCSHCFSSLPNAPAKVLLFLLQVRSTTNMLTHVLCTYPTVLLRN